MKPTTKILLLIIILTTGVVLGRMVRTPASDSSVQQATTNTSSGETTYETREHAGGDVTVSVTPLSLKPGLPASFDVAFETHSVDLAFDVIKVASFTDDTSASYTPFWDGSPPGGHHRKGTLRFTPDLSKASKFTLTFRNIAGITERTFTWEVKQ